MPRFALLTLLLAPLTLFLGCGGDAESATSPSNTTETGTPTAEPTETSTDTTETSLSAAPSKILQAAEGDWPWWRGPNYNGTTTGQEPPTEWSETKNVLWKTPVPGRGHSSPTIVGDTIYMATADEQKQVQSVLAFDRATGKPRWKRDVSQGGFPRTHPNNTHATCTVACDGKHVFAAFHHHAKVTLTALDLDGKPAWEKVVGPFDPQLYEYGYAPSPLLYDDLVIVSGDYEDGGWIKAFERATGKPAWQTDRPEKLSFSSPIVANVAGRDQLLISGCEKVSSYDPATGKLLWAVAGTTMATCGTMVWDGDTVYASGGYPRKQTIAVKADGSGEILWTNTQKCYEQSMLATGGHVYAVTDNGIAFCWHGQTGEELWRERLVGPVSASPVLANGHVYATNEKGTTFVFAATPDEFRPVAKNQLGTESFATQTFVGNKIYARVANRGPGGRQEMLYCIGK